jgi:hypothetical protein
LKAEKQWIGEEGLLEWTTNQKSANNDSKSVLDSQQAKSIPKSWNGVFLYSAIAKNYVSAMEIDISDFKTKFPRDYTQKLTSAARTWYEYLINRMRCISKSSKIIYDFVQKQGLYNQVYNSTKKKHPNASKNMVINIGNHGLRGNVADLVPSSVCTINNPHSKIGRQVNDNWEQNENEADMHDFSRMIKKKNRKFNRENRENRESGDYNNDGYKGGMGNSYFCYCYLKFNIYDLLNNNSNLRCRQ